MNILDVCSNLKINEVDVDFIGKGNIWINDTFDSYVGLFARSILAEAIKNTSPGQLTIYGYDSSISGLFSSFSALSSIEPKFLEIMTDDSDFTVCLEQLTRHVVSVQNIMQDRYASLIEFRKTVNSPIESYKLVVLYLDVAFLDKKSRVKLKNLLLNGPKCGVSFAIISPSPVLLESAGGKNISINPEMFDPKITIIEIEGFSAQIRKDGYERQVSWTPVNPNFVVKLCDNYVKEYQTTPLPSVSFLDLHKDEKIWSRSSADGLTFSVGTYGTNSMEITIGEEKTQKHNALITGAVGQGKSNLISVIVHSLCMRYSPKELHLYLMDFKEGVSFKAFSNIDREEYLPHAQALGLECDSEFGEVVLEHLFSEYKERMKLLKDQNAKSIKELREDHPEIEMPRIVCIIDEFQLMFEGNKDSSNRIVELLEMSVRLFRAAGIHFILASQTLSNTGNVAYNSKKESLFAQVPIRIALKNTVRESLQTLSEKNPAAAYLRPREAVINTDYGEISQNKKTTIAYADEKKLIPLRRAFWEQTKSWTRPPYVFDNKKKDAIINHREDVIYEYDKSAKYSAYLGEFLSVSGEKVAAPLTREQGRNIAIIGLPDEDNNTAIGMIQNIALGLALQGNKKKRLIFCSFEESYDFRINYSKFIELLGSPFCDVEYVEPDNFNNLLSELIEAENEAETFIFCICLDKWEFVSERLGPPSPLQPFAEKMAAKGVHLIGWWQTISNFKKQIMGLNFPADSFSSRVILRVDDRELSKITHIGIRYSAQCNRALLYDPVESVEKMFIPYSPIND